MFCKIWLSSSSSLITEGNQVGFSLQYFLQTFFFRLDFFSQPKASRIFQSQAANTAAVPGAGNQY